MLKRKTEARFMRIRHFIAVWALLLTMQPVLCEDLSGSAVSSGSVTQEILEAKIAEVEATAGIEEQAKAQLIEFYRKALSNLQTASSAARATADFRQVAQTAPTEVRALRDAMEKANSSPPEDSLDVESTTSLRQFEQLLKKEKADLAAVDAKRADFDQRLEEEAGRSAVILQRLTEAKSEQEEVSAQLRLPPPSSEGPATLDGRRWVLETRFDALSAEIKMLDRELLSQPMRVDLLQVKRDKAAASVQWVGRRVKVLEGLANRKRQVEAEQARAEAVATRREAEGKHPLVVGLAEGNAALSEELARMASGLGMLAGEAGKADKLARKIEANFKRANDAIEIGGLSHELGQMLQRQRQSLPDLRANRRAAEESEDKAAKVGVRRLRHQEEEQQLSEIDAFVSGILVEAAVEETPLLRRQLLDLAEDRKGLLKKAIKADDIYLRNLGELKSVQRRLLEAVEDYDGFLDENMLWVRSTALFQVDQLSTLVEQMWGVLSLKGWREVVRTLAYQAVHSPVFALLAVALAILCWGRQRMIKAIHGLGDKLGKPTTDNFGFTLLALALTLIAASAWPIVMAAIGWQLKVSVEATDFTAAVGTSLLLAASQLYYLRAFRLICMPDGLAAAHFRWTESSLRLLRAELDQLSWIFLPAALVTVVASKLDPLNVGWAIGRISFLITVGSLAVAFARLLHLKRGIFADYMRGRQKRTFRRLYRLWYPLVVIQPLIMGVLAIMGYLYTAGTLTELFLNTVWLAVELVMVAALVERWLLVTRRRLVYEAAMERRETRAQEGRAEPVSRSGEEGATFEVEEPEIDLVTLSDRSRKLLNTSILFYGAFGLWLIWSDVFPALAILDQVTLWHHAVTVDGEAQIQPVTLASVGLALFYAVITVILAKQLPAVLEIILLYSTEMQSGNRYTIITLTNYAVITAGIVLVFNTIGTDWSQLQWLVAALGVGIGFGLQEIVANFISGIIVLFERPIRIGDVVTVGNTDGVVTKIQGRATTIRNWDGQELLVPNKEFITGRLLNWSLSDQTTRIILSVGIAYGSNVRQAMQLLEEAATENEDVLDDPAPSVIFEAFGDNSLAMALRCFVDSADLRYPTISALNEAINDKFNAAGIIIAFPQRDLHLTRRQDPVVGLHHLLESTESIEQLRQQVVDATVRRPRCALPPDRLEMLERLARASQSEKQRGLLEG